MYVCRVCSNKTVLDRVHPYTYTHIVVQYNIIVSIVCIYVQSLFDILWRGEFTSSHYTLTHTHTHQQITYIILYCTIILYIVQVYIYNAMSLIINLLTKYINTIQYNATLIPKHKHHIHMYSNDNNQLSISAYIYK